MTKSSQSTSYDEPEPLPPITGVRRTFAEPPRILPRGGALYDQQTIGP